MRIATYNVRVADGGKSIEGIAKEFKSCGADIIGIQELDLNVKRCENIDVLKLLSEKSGYKNYHFFPTIPLQGGYYGIGILSKNPILNISIYKYLCPNLEQRALGVITVEINGKTINFFNTHLSYENFEVRSKQFKLIQDIVKENIPYIITGDFNVKTFEEFNAIKDCTFANTQDNPFITFKGDNSNKNEFYSIDNIVASKEFKIIHAEVSPSEYSDHEMLIADIEFNK